MLEMNENEDIGSKNMAAANAVLRGKFIAMNVYLNWEKILCQ